MAEELVKVEVYVTAETATDIDELRHEKGWGVDEGLRILLGMGIGAARGEAARFDAEAQERMIARLAEVEGSLAVLRARMFEMEKANEAWDLSTGAIRQQNLGFQGLINRQKEELDTLKLENARLRAGLESLQAHQPPQADQHAPAKSTSRPKPGSLRDRLKGK